MTALLIAAAMSLAQIETPQAGAVYDVYYRDGAEYHTVYGYVREVGEQRMEITLDEPWRADRRRFYVQRRDVVDLKPEPPEDRERRRQRGWQEAGYELVDTAHGVQPILRADVELAARAHAMAEAAAQEDDGPPAPGEPATPELLARPGFWAQWWAHAAVTAGAVVLLAVIAATLLFRKE